MIQNDINFFTNEPERDLYTRFATILKSNTQFFDILEGILEPVGFSSFMNPWRMLKKLEFLQVDFAEISINISSTYNIGNGGVFHYDYW